MNFRTLKHISANYYFLFLFVVLFSRFSYAQPHSALFINYTVSEGLTDKTIHCIFQDSEGWVWIGTDFGVLRFDGYSFTKFKINSPEGELLASSLIRTLYESKDGVLWIGTELNGVFRYDRETYKITSIGPSQLSNGSVWSIVEDKPGYFWFGSENGLNYYSEGENKIVKRIDASSHPQLLSNDFIRKLHIDNNGRLWVGTGGGVSVLNRDLTLNLKLLEEKSSANDLENQVWEIYQDSKENIWIGTYLGGLYKYSFRDDILETMALNTEVERSFTVRSIVQDNQGDIWIGTRGGLFSIDAESKSVSHYIENTFDDHSLVHNSVLSLLIDNKGDLWIGTRNGISYLNFERKAFAFLNTYNSGNTLLNNSEVYAFWQDKNDNLWIGTESGGVNIYQPKSNTMRYLTTREGLSNNCVKSIHPAGNGKVLIGTYLGGLNLYDPVTGRNKVFLHDENDPASLSDNSVWEIYTDSKNRIWVGTSTGIDMFDLETEKFTHFGSKYESSWVSVIYEDKQERLWLYSTELKRLTMITPGGTIKHLPFQSRSVISAEDDEGVWISTMGEGLLKYYPEKDQMIRYTIDDGLCSNVIYGMIKSGSYLWLSTNNGLSRFDIDQKEFKNFYVTNGLLNNQFNYSAALACSNNMLVFGGKKGVDLVYPSLLQENLYRPPVVLTSIRLFNKDMQIDTNLSAKNVLNNFISETSELTLSYNNNMVSFDFAALNYANSERNRYKYKLEGFDKEWNDIGTNHSATYTNLDYGHYTFRVIGTNSDNKYNPEGLSFKLVILPPFWKTWWFRTILLTIIGVMLYFIYGFILNREKLRNQLHFERQKSRNIKEIDRLKHQFFMNISHEIRTPLSLISGPLDKMLKTPMGEEEVRSHLTILKRNTEILSKLVNQLLDYRRIETGNLKLELKKGNLNVFVDHIIEPFYQMAEDKGVSLEVNVTQKSIFFSFDADKLEKILNNLISNAIKYTNSDGAVSFSISTTFMDELDNTSNFIPPISAESDCHQYVKFTVRDTGIGIPEGETHRIFDRFRQVRRKGDKNSASGAGIGLSLTKELVKLHHGHIRVKSIEGKGSKFTLLIPFVQTEEAAESVEDKVVELEEVLEEKSLNEAQAESLKASAPIMIIADDNPDIRTFIKHHFMPEYNVVEAIDGKQGWEKTLEFVPDLIISDIMMPNVDGVEFCRKIKNDERTSHIPVILLTALSAKEKQFDGISAGAEDYIVKPFDVGLLKAKADNLLYIRKALRERYSKELHLKPKDIVLTSPDEKFLKKVIQVIEKNISQPDLDVDYLARNVGVSRTQLYRKISALTDMAAKEFVRDIRLKRAAQLLTQDKLNISEIALEVGFNDISYFRKCFKDKYGVSASKYVKANS